MDLKISKHKAKILAQPARRVQSILMKQIKENDQKLIHKKRLEIQVAPQFVNLFKKSETMSS